MEPFSVYSLRRVWKGPADKQLVAAAIQIIWAIRRVCSFKHGKHGNMETGFVVWSMRGAARRETMDPVGSTGKEKHGKLGAWGM